ncbi:hypothetical protein MKW92_010033 [Papaver armeniacum]|nr:hypothetical protein MKW92_010033 [Papaver armeniacum]
MEDNQSSSSRTIQHDMHLASRKAEETALRRYQAAGWLESFIGPVSGLSSSKHPSEVEFVSSLKNGLVLCNLINKIQPGSVPKVIESSSSTSLASVSDGGVQPLLAYQYFENVRNFLVAVKELNFPAFEASDLEMSQVSLVGGSSAKIVDCVLALKGYHEWKQWKGDASGFHKHTYAALSSRSPMALLAGNAKNLSHTAPGTPLGPRRQLDMSSFVINDETSSTEAQNCKTDEDLLVGGLAQCLVNMKENVDQNLLNSFHHGNLDSVKLFSQIMPNYLQEHQVDQVPEECMNAAKYKRQLLLKAQERELTDLKKLLTSTKKEVEVLQVQFQSDLEQIGSQVQELASAALGYGRVVKENRDLYNMVQDLKGNIRVYCRVKPSFSSEAKTVIDFIGNDGSLMVVDPLKSQNDGRKGFQFNRVFGPSASQEEVYNDTQPLIRSVMDGYNVCIFAYGQTGSGKTHTMCGPSGSSATDMGVNYRSLNDLFNISYSRKDTMNYELRVQMVEIYNEQFLFLTINTLEIRNCISNGMSSLPDATIHLVLSSEDILNLMKLGEKNRAISSTSMNIQSSRSHSVLTVHVQGKDTSGSFLHSCLHLVDLAGSERVDKSEVTGDRLKEAQYINKSLSCLGDVIMALAQKNSHIPYRNSKLTQLLQSSLGGHAKTLMFAHVSPEAESLGETISTLKFAQRVSTVELGAARLNKEDNEVRELRKQVEILKASLARKEEQTVKHHQAKELGSPRQMISKVMTENTPPRSRRLSIESCTAVKTETFTNSENRKRLEKSVAKTKVMTENTPPRSRRLSIESCTAVKAEKVTNSENKKGFEKTVAKPKPGIECTPKRLRRLSLEGPAYVKDLQFKSSEKEVCATIRCQQNRETNSNGRDERSPTEDCHLNISASRILTSGTFKKDVKERTHPVQQLLKTPERATCGKTVFQTATPSDFGFSTSKYQTPNVASGASRKPSQIRKSLQTIGKFISGSERRNQQEYQKEIQLPSHGNVNVDNVKSPSIASSRPLRRQSLTGAQISGMSRRSSLGGKSDDSFANETRRNAVTPPPMHKDKRWL